MFRALLRIGQQVRLIGIVLGGRLTTRAGAGDRTDRHYIIAQPDQDLGAGTHDLKSVKAEKEEEG